VTRLTQMQALVYLEIQRSGEAGVSLERLESLLEEYRNLRRLDAPKDPKMVVRVTVNQIKNRGGTIVDGRKGDRRYRILTG